MENKKIYHVTFELEDRGECSDVDEYVTWKSHEFGFSVKNVRGTSKNDFWFSKVFGLYITEESLVKINKFFGFDNPYLDNNNN